MHGIMVAHTDDLDDTIEYLRGLQMWSDKASHDSLLRRSNPGADSPWGTTSSRAWSLHFLQGIDGLGPKVAAAILDYFGKLPFELSVTEAELLQVPGVGPKMARKIMETFK